ncbi:MAG: patatin-like phospholipase family protein [Bacteroidales bacterium]|jgi:NTE family protein|nr:patatin-like phospholipase family protein [Bacteroidales bacterium]
MKKNVFVLALVVSFLQLVAQNFKLDSFRFGPERPKIGVVLSGGGAKGIAHVGTLKMLEELNIPIDFIGGTSMGAVIGGLYAMGYTAEQLDTVIWETDWMNLFNDAPNRQYVGISEKANTDPYQLRIAFDPKQMTFTRGMINGQHIDNMLNHYFLEAYETPNFSDLKIPFFCVGTDIMSGEYTVLDTGNLARSVRASMAVPTVFSPIEIDGQLLVDGGVINNFPVLEMRKRGADIIIGVDVGYEYKDHLEMQNLAQVLEQVVFMSGKQINEQNIQDCDIMIRPDLAKLSALSFGRADTILERGYVAAREAYPELKVLADRLSERYNLPPTVRDPYHPDVSVIIDTIIFHGNEKFSLNYMMARLQLKTGHPVSVNEVEEAVERLFGSLSYDKVTYYFMTSPHGKGYAELHLNVKESPLNDVKMGLRYDIIRGPAILAGITAKNFLIRNTEFNANLDLSTYPVLDLQYRFSPMLGSAKRPSFLRPSFYLSYLFCNLALYDYEENGTNVSRRAEYNVIGQRLALGTEVGLKNNTLGFGLFRDQTISSQYVGVSGEILSSDYWYLQGYYLRNSFNKKHFPTQGSVITLRGRLLRSVDDKVADEPLIQKFGTYYAHMQHAIPVSKYLTLYPSAMVGGTFVLRKEDVSSNYISQQQQFYQGGLFGLPFINQTPFAGLFPMQKSGIYAANVQFSAQYEALKNVFLTARIGALKSELDYADMFDLSNLTMGAGLSLAVQTTIGPIGITVHGSNQSKVGVFVNFGFWF